MKKKFTIIGIILATIILAVVAVLTAIKIREMGTRPVAPSAPESEPGAQGTLPVEPSASCKVTFLAEALTPTPTLTPSPTPTGTLTPTPTPTNTPMPTPTPTSIPGPSGESYCDYLFADPANGSGPLTVQFSGKGYDTARIKGFRFTFGDGEKKQVLNVSYSSSHIEAVSHTYNNNGIYKAVLEILDDGDHWKTRSECEKTITVSGKVTYPTPTPKPTTVARVTQEPVPTEVQLPVAGIKIPTLGGIIAGFLLISLGIALVF